MKRVAISTISSVVPTSNGKDKNKSNKNKNKKASKDETQTIRFEIQLPTTTDDSFPEFSFEELMKEFQDRHKKPDGSEYDPDDPFNEKEEDDKLRALAKQFEIKYSSKKKYRASAEDYIDKGFGYDENDSFIDNGEAYDELIPSSITTKHGGFYINVGKLEFRTCSDDEGEAVLIEEGEDSQDYLRRANKKRRSMNDSTGSKSQSLTKKRRRILSSDDDEEEANDDDGSRDLDSDNDEDDDMEEDDGSSGSSSSEVKRNKFDGNLQSIDSVINSVILKPKRKKGPKEIPNISSSSSNDVLILNDSGGEDVPTRVTEIINKFREMNLNQSEKKRVFTNEMNDMLIELELAVCDLKSSIRNQVYNNLSSVLGCSKETTIKRLKKLRVTHEENRMRQLIATLRTEVRTSLDIQEEEWDEKCELLHDQWEADREKGLNVPDKPKFPEKLFKFNDSIISLLRQILKCKRLLVEFAGIKGKQEEDNITNFFNNEVKNVWLSGWISKEQLLNAAGFTPKQEPAKINVSVVNKTNQNASTSSAQISATTSSTNINSNVKKSPPSPSSLLQSSTAPSKATANVSISNSELSNALTSSSVVSSVKETTTIKSNKVVTNPVNPSWNQSKLLSSTTTTSETVAPVPSASNLSVDKRQQTKSSVEPEGLLYSINKMARNNTQMSPKVSQQPLSLTTNSNSDSVRNLKESPKQLTAQERHNQQQQLLQKMRASFANRQRQSLPTAGQASPNQPNVFVKGPTNLSRSTSNLNSMNMKQQQQQQQPQQSQQNSSKPFNLSQQQQQQLNKSLNINQMKNFSTSNQYAQMQTFAAQAAQQYLQHQKQKQASLSSNQLKSEIPKDISNSLLNVSQQQQQQQQQQPKKQIQLPKHVPLMHSNQSTQSQMQQQQQPSTSVQQSTSTSSASKTNKAFDVDYKFDHAIKRTLIEDAKKVQGPAAGPSQSSSKPSANQAHSNLQNRKATTTAQAENLFQQLLQQSLMPNVATSLAAGAGLQFGSNNQQNNMNLALQHMYLSHLCQQQMSNSKKDKPTQNNPR